MKTHIVSFSGGQTSGYMLRKLMDANPNFDEKFEVVFENTGKEHDSTLDFVHEVETRWSVPVTWLEYCRVPSASIDPNLVPNDRKRSNLLKQQSNNETAHWFRVVNYSTAKRSSDNDTPFDELLSWAKVLPNVRTRMCSVQMKVRTRDRYLRSKGIGQFAAYIGIRKDEEHRKHEIMVNIDKYEEPNFPLCDMKVTKQDVDSFWNSHSFKLNIPNHMGNCNLCFLKAKWKRVAAAKHDPKAAQWWVDWENKFSKKTYGDGAFFRQGQSYAGILEEALHPEFDFDQSDEDVACSCAIGGYRNNQDQED